LFTSLKPSRNGRSKLAMGGSFRVSKVVTICRRWGRLYAPTLRNWQES